MLTTWNMAFDGVRISPEAVTILQVAAFLAPDGVPDWLIKERRTDGEPLVDPGAFEESLGLLFRYSLIKRDGNAFSIHRLVQEVVRASLDGQDKIIRLSQCLHLLDRVFPADDNDADDVRRESLLPHVLAAVQHAADIEVDPSIANRLLLRVGAFMGRRAQHEGVAATLRHAHAIAVATHGQDNPAVARGLVTLGTLLREQGDLSAASTCFERALDIAEPFYGRGDSNVTSLLNELARVSREQGDAEAALRYVDRALASQGEGDRA